MEEMEETVAMAAEAAEMVAMAVTEAMEVTAAGEIMVRIHLLVYMRIIPKNNI